MTESIASSPADPLVMHVITNFTGNAGAETMLARLLHRTSHSTVVVPLIDVSERNRRLSENPLVSFTPLGCRATGAGAVLDIGRASLRLRSLIRARQPSAVMCWMYHAMVVGTVASKLAGGRQRLFWNVRQSLDDPAALTRSTRLAVVAAKHLSSRPFGIIYNSARALERHVAYGYRDHNSSVIPNGFPMPEPSESRSRPRLLGIAGRYHPQKDYGTFFSAAALVAKSHPDIRFVAVGKGVEGTNAELRQSMEKAGLSPDAIELRGEQSDMSRFYEEIDGLVLSSRTEGFPNVVAEAMGHGKPVVGTDVGDTAAIIADTGFVCPPRYPEALAEAMRALLALSSSQYAALCGAARERVRRNYGLSPISERYDALLAG